MLALGIVAGAVDLQAAALLAQVAEFLPAEAQGVVHIGGALPGLLPFPFDLGLAGFEALLFGAQSLGLPLLLGGLSVDLAQLTLAVHPVARQARRNARQVHGAARPGARPRRRRWRDVRRGAAFSARAADSSSCWDSATLRISAIWAPSTINSCSADSRSRVACSQSRKSCCGALLRGSGVATQAGDLGLAAG